jgi:hypothetical protein
LVFEIVFGPDVKSVKDTSTEMPAALLLDQADRERAVRVKRRCRRASQPKLTAAGSMVSVVYDWTVTVW